MDQLAEHEFAELVQGAYAKLWTLATAIVNDRALAEDVVQEATITGLRKIADYQRGTNFTVWMSQIVRFTALNHRKSRKRRNAQSLDEHIVLSPVEKEQTGPAPVTDEGQLADGQTDFDDELTHAISELSSERRACLLLRVVHGMTYEEISEVVGVPEGSAMSHVHRAKKVMRQRLKTTGDKTTGDLESKGNTNDAS